MVPGRLRFFWRQMNVQFRMRALNSFSLGLLVLQPAIFSGVGLILSRLAGQEKPDLVYTIIGGGVFGLWSSLLFSSFFDITRDRREGMLELIVGSPTPLGTILGIRTLANVLTGLISLSGSFLLAAILFDYSFMDVQLWQAAISFLTVLFSFWCIGLFLANFHAWSRVSGSFINFLELPVGVLCGFMFPVRILPGWMRTISALIPIRWGLEALDASIAASSNQTLLWKSWVFALGLSLAYLYLAKALSIKVHDSIRVTGEMSSI